MHEKLAKGQIYGELNWDKKEKFFKAEGQFSLLDNLITGKGGLKSTPKSDGKFDLNLYVTGNVSVPNFIDVLGGMQIGSGNGLFRYSNDGSLSNDFIAGWGTIGFQKLGVDFKAITGFKYNFDGTTSPIGSFEIESLNQLIKGEGSTLPGLAFNNSLAYLNEPLDNQNLPQTVQQGLQIAQIKLKQFATDIDLSTKLNIAFGNIWNTEKAQVLAQAWAEGNFSSLPPIQIRPSATISGANAAFASATNTIYIASEYVTQNAADLDAVARVLLEEIGHYIDAQVNVLDAFGDEGAIFSALLSGEMLTESQLQQLRAEDDTVTINLDGENIQLNLNSSQQDTFRIGAGKPWLAITANWDNAASNVPIQLKAPDGTIYTEADIANSDKIAILEQLTNSIKKTIVVVNPTPGDWALKVVDTANLGNVKFAALAGTNAPTIELTSLTQDASNQNVTINYKAFDVDSDAKISLFYDTDGEGFDGILLADNLIEKDGAGNYVWNTKDVPIDNYHIYALAMDENSAPVFAYSPAVFEAGTLIPHLARVGGGNPPFTLPTPIPEPTPTPTLDESNRGDTLIGTNSNDLIIGRQGDEVLIGKLGNDSLFGGWVMTYSMAIKAKTFSMGIRVTIPGTVAKATMLSAVAKTMTGFWATWEMITFSAIWAMTH